MSLFISEKRYECYFISSNSRLKIPQSPVQFKLLQETDLYSSSSMNTLFFLIMAVVNVLLSLLYVLFKRSHKPIKIIFCLVSRLTLHLAAQFLKGLRCGVVVMWEFLSWGNGVRTGPVRQAALRGAFVSPSLLLPVQVVLYQELQLCESRERNIVRRREKTGFKVLHTKAKHFRVNFVWVEINKKRSKY